MVSTTASSSLKSVANQSTTRICVVGLGYVGLPLALAFGRTNIPTVGFDIKEDRIKELAQGRDANNESLGQEFAASKTTFTSDMAQIGESNFIIVTVPTPITQAKKPDLTLIKMACRSIGRQLKAGSIVVFESTVYPGVTEDICVPILEQESGLQYQKEFAVGFSPERINPGDRKHTLEKVIKIVSGSNPEASAKVAEVYGQICEAGIHIASSIKVAEAAKVIENTQRDLNIALVNELSMLFNRLGIDSLEVLEAAGTKWNFHNYRPGLVGGHCIGVDPYYLVYKAQEVGHQPDVITAGRRINDGMTHFVVDLVVKNLIKANKKVAGSKLLVLGASFKENVSDTRNSKVLEVIEELGEYGIETDIYDPNIKLDKKYNLLPSLPSQAQYDALLLAVNHRQFEDLSQSDYQSILADKAVFVDLKGAAKEVVRGLDSVSYFRL
ncbi:nucleotide sugar dehydrogenase [Candidatus Berkelbacteria bacterium]|nr:nucleotide sugar dehydrogenase [Candidatus Berkelbacteria bacterium]